MSRWRHLNSNPDGDLALNNGDVLTIPQVPGLNDLGASISLRGEVLHPGAYGIRPGEKLSSVLLRAGGFSPAAYPYGAVLLRSEVQKIEQRSYGELVQRVREQQTSLKLTATSATDPDQKLSAEAALVQWQSTLDNLMNTPPAGRVTIQISSNITELGEHLPGPHSTGWRCSRGAETPQLCSGAGPGLRTDRGGISTRQKRQVVSAAGRRHDKHGQ